MHVLLALLNRLFCRPAKNRPFSGRIAPFRIEAAPKPLSQGHHVGICGAHPVLRSPFSILCSPFFIPHLCPVGIPHPSFHVGVCGGFLSGSCSGTPKNLVENRLHARQNNPKSFRNPAVEARFGSGVTLPSSSIVCRSSPLFGFKPPRRETLALEF
jgi:hypothetical protein